MLFEQIRRNKQKSFFFVVGFFLFIQLFGVALGELVFGYWLMGVLVTSITAIVYIAVMISSSELVIMKMNHGKSVTKEEYLIIYNIVEEISLVSGLKTIPKIYIIQEDSPNAFATGLSPDKSAIGITTALIDKLNREELEGVIAHEVAYIVSHDCRLSTITIALISTVLFLGDMIFYRSLDNDTPSVVAIFSIVFMILSPVIAYAIHFAISRNREYLADSMAVNFTRNPIGLKNALLKIDNDPDMVENIPRSCAAMYIADPLKKRFKNGKKVNKADIFSTHPTIEIRVDRLERM